MRAIVKNYVDRAVIPPNQLAAGVTLDHVAEAADKVLNDGYSLRDGRVMREALRIAELENSGAGKAWSAVLERLEAALPTATFRMWVLPIGRPSGFRDDVLIFEDCPPTVAAWITRRYTTMIVDALDALDSEFTRIEIRS